MQAEDTSDKEFLEQWLLGRLHEMRSPADFSKGPADVTVLAYHFWAEEESDERFRFIEASVRETWRQCGLMKTVLVVDAPPPYAVAFAGDFSPWVDIQVEPGLVPGQIHTMSVDCNGKLCTRFATSHVLLVQNDGFPLRPGLEDFLGKWDYIGAPYVRDAWWKRAVCRALGCWVSNGGFSLRTHDICERAAYYWEKKYKDRGDSHDVTEDLFYTQTLPIREHDYRRHVHVADNRSALAFSYDALVPMDCKALPFGFHRDCTFAVLQPRLADTGNVRGASKTEEI
jgi:hypothetical protein